MTDIAKKINDQWQDCANLVLGIWLLISPWLLGYAAEAKPAWNAHTVGVIIAVAAAAALVAFQKWEEWVNVGLAAWLIVSPYLLGYDSLQAALWNQLIVGVLVGLLGIWAGVTLPGGLAKGR